jgi:hypothetical protein
LILRQTPPPPLPQSRTAANGRDFCDMLLTGKDSRNASFTEKTSMWQFANDLLEKTERYTLQEWMLIGACALFVSAVYLLTKQR